MSLSARRVEHPPQRRDRPRAREPEPVSHALLELQRRAGNAAVARLVQARSIQRAGPATTAAGTTTAAFGGAQPPEVQNLLGELTALVAQGGRTEQQLLRVRMRLDQLPPRIQLAHAGVLNRLSDALAVELRGLEVLAQAARPPVVNDAATPYQATNNCALTTIGALTGKTAGQVAGGATPDDKFFSTAFLGSLGGAEKRGWDARLEEAGRDEHAQGAVESVLADAQFAGMQAYLRSEIAAHGLPLTVSASAAPMPLQQCKDAMQGFPLGTRFAFKYHGHWNYAQLNDGGGLVFLDFQQDHVQAHLIRPAVQIDPKALTGSPAPILPMNSPDDPEDVLDIYSDMNAFSFIAVAPSQQRRARTFSLPAPERYREMKDRATQPGRHGQMSVSKYTERLRDFDAHVAASKWAKAHNDAVKIFDGLTEMSTKKGYWIDDQAKAAYFNPLLGEVTEVKLRAQRAAQG